MIRLTKKRKRSGYVSGSINGFVCYHQFWLYQNSLTFIDIFDIKVVAYLKLQQYADGDQQDKKKFDFISK